MYCTFGVYRRFRCQPLRNCLFTPELQWQPRGKRRILQGCAQTGNAWARTDVSWNRAAQAADAKSQAAVPFHFNTPGLSPALAFSTGTQQPPTRITHSPYKAYGDYCMSVDISPCHRHGAHPSHACLHTVYPHREGCRCVILHFRTEKCQLRTEKCQFSTEKCQLRSEKCQFSTEKCQFRTEKCQLSTETCQFRSEKCQLSTETCQFRTEKCQFSTEKCQFRTEKCQFSTEKCQLIHTGKRRWGSRGEGVGKVSYQHSYNHHPWTPHIYTGASRYIMCMGAPYIYRGVQVHYCTPLPVRYQHPTIIAVCFVWGVCG
jgi:hypothetical protein